jgi:hypothetical protein
MATNNSAVFSGKLSVGKYGVNPVNRYGQTVFNGWWLQVRDENGYPMVGMPVRTEDFTVAEQLKSVKVADVSLVGFIRSENVAKQVKGDDGQYLAKELQPAPEYKMFFYVEDIESVYPEA